MKMATALATFMLSAFCSMSMASPVDLCGPEVQPVDGSYIHKAICWIDANDTQRLLVRIYERSSFNATTTFAEACVRVESRDGSFINSYWLPTGGFSYEVRGGFTDHVHGQSFEQCSWAVPGGFTVGN